MNCWILAAALLLADIAERPYPAVTYQRTELQDPPQQIHAVAVDLTRPGVKVGVSRGGPDPDGDGPWTTTLMRPTAIAEREKFDLVVNGDFFALQSGKDAEGTLARTLFREAIPAKVIGAAETGNVVWSTGAAARPMLVVDKKGRLSVVTGKRPPKDAAEAISGHDLLVKGGQNVAPVKAESGYIKGPHPRTAVGVRDQGRTLLVVVVDGRRKDAATGMSLAELADVLLKLGAEEGINLDGGGSSVLAIRDPATHKMTILNQPSDGAERAVGNVLGVQVPR